MIQMIGSLLSFEQNLLVEIAGGALLITKTSGELQATHYRTAKIAALTTLIGAVLITIITPIFYWPTRDRFSCFALLGSPSLENISKSRNKGKF